MKKLMIAAAIVCAAAFAQAAAVTWSTGKFQTAGTGGNGWSGSTISAAITESDGWLAEIFFFSDAGCTKAVADLTGTTDNTASKTGKAFNGTTNDKFDANGTYYTYLTLKDNAGNTLTSEVMSFTVDPLQNPDVNFWSGDGFNEAKLHTTYGDYPATGWTAAAPEPTSGLLLLIGMAGLALRRRRA